MSPGALTAPLPVSAPVAQYPTYAFIAYIMRIYRLKGFLNRYSDNSTPLHRLQLHVALVQSVLVLSFTLSLLYLPPRHHVLPDADSTAKDYLLFCLLSTLQLHHSKL